MKAHVFRRVCALGGCALTISGLSTCRSPSELCQVGSWPAWGLPWAISKALRDCAQPLLMRVDRSQDEGNADGASGRRSELEATERRAGHFVLPPRPGFEPPTEPSSLRVGCRAGRFPGLRPLARNRV